MMYFPVEHVITGNRWSSGYEGVKGLRMSMRIAAVMGNNRITVDSHQTPNVQQKKSSRKSLSHNVCASGDLAAAGSVVPTTDEVWNWSSAKFMQISSDIAENGSELQTGIWLSPRRKKSSKRTLVHLLWKRNLLLQSPGSWSCTTCHSLSVVT